MSFDHKTLIPLPSEWFSKTIEYRGVGRAGFDDPKGYLEGPTTVKVSETGQVTAEMVAERIQCERDLPFGLMEFLSRDKPTKTEKGWSLGYTGRRNPCVRLLVECEGGSFTTIGSVSYGHSSSLRAKTGQVRFDPLRARYEASGAGPSKFWVLPLVNFVSEFVQSHPQLDRHPLRIYPTPIVPADLAKEALRAQLYANQRNRLIVFEISRAPGFIERLPDYPALSKQLESGEIQHAVTSVMVGELGAGGSDPEMIESRLFVEYLLLLGLATGNEVGAPWLESRDVDGRLVSRLHTAATPPPFTKGRPLIDEGVSRGIGRLLSRAQLAPDFGEDYLRVAMLNTIRGGLRSPWQAEDAFTHLIRALECLGKQFKLGTQDLLEGTDKETAETIRSTLAEASSRIHGLAEGKPDVVTARLTRIGRKVSSAADAERRFGQMVVEVLNHFDLPDASVVQSYYQQNPRHDKRDWPGLLVKLRGAVVHEGYFRISDGAIDFDDIVTVAKHLHDVMVRILLKILYYDGAYQPTVLVWTSPQRADWVTPTTGADRLGYGALDDS